MKSNVWITVMLVALVMAAGCAPAVHVERDPTASLATYKTYSWVETRASQHDGQAARTTDFARLTVENAANDQLQKKGWQLVTANPDVLLSYDILVERNVAQRSDPVYTQPMTRFYYNPFFSRWGTIYYPTQFAGYDNYEVPVRRATFTINMMDAKTDKKVWQGWTTADVNSRRPSPDEVKRGINSIMNKFVPGGR